MVVSGPKDGKSYECASGSNGLLQSKKKAGITKAHGIHTLRHSFATHLLYYGTDIYTLKRLLGHASIKSTIKYLHLIPERISKLKSPLDFLDDDEQ
jgi:site-specific recombinase XerD